jgi:hypothetical protein
MNQPWSKIISRYEEYGGGDTAIHAMLALSKYIASGSLAAGLHAWTSMFDLCITQTEVEYPYDGPYLKVSPLRDGRVEFRYVDTQVEEQRWNQTVAAVDTVPRLLIFLAQLRWFQAESLDPVTSNISLGADTLQQNGASHRLLRAGPL